MNCVLWRIWAGNEWHFWKLQLLVAQILGFALFFPLLEPKAGRLLKSKVKMVPQGFEFHHLLHNLYQFQKSNSSYVQTIPLKPSFRAHPLWPDLSLDVYLGLQCIRMNTYQLLIYAHICTEKHRHLSLRRQSFEQGVRKKLEEKGKTWMWKVDSGSVLSPIPYLQKSKPQKVGAAQRQGSVSCSL